MGKGAKSILAIHFIRALFVLVMKLATKKQLEALSAKHGPEPLEKLKHKIDYDHYIKKQIEPIANQILAMFNKSLEDLIKGNKQSKLF